MTIFQDDHYDNVHQFVNHHRHIQENFGDGREPIAEVKQLHDTYFYECAEDIYQGHETNIQWAAEGIMFNWNEPSTIIYNLIKDIKQEIENEHSQLKSANKNKPNLIDNIITMGGAKKEWESNLLKMSKSIEIKTEKLKLLEFDDEYREYSPHIRDEANKRLQEDYPGSHGVDYEILLARPDAAELIFRGRTTSKIIDEYQKMLLHEDKLQKAEEAYAKLLGTSVEHKNPEMRLEEKLPGAGKIYEKATEQQREANLERRQQWLEKRLAEKEQKREQQSQQSR